jgi:hypothetical protein
VAVDTNFFDAGGHSLLVPALQVMLAERTGTELSIVDLFASPTIATQARLLSAGSQEEAPPEVITDRRGGAAARARRMAS